MSSPSNVPSQARSIATRARLLASAVDALVADGYAGASTTSIAKRAQVSQGALFKHFPSKHALLGEALQQLFTELVEEFRQKLVRDARPDRLGAAVGILWEIFCSPKLQGAFELYLAARTDTELAALVTPVLAAHRQNLLAEARALFPAAADHNPDFDPMILSIMNMMQGAALAASVIPTHENGERELALIERIARQELMRGAVAANAAARAKSEASNRVPAKGSV
jgi:AcrR family transcriptional regulator